MPSATGYTKVRTDELLGGKADLDEDGIVPAAQLPDFIAEVESMLIPKADLEGGFLKDEQIPSTLATKSDILLNTNGGPEPRDHAFAAWTYPPEQVISGKAGISGTLYLARVYVPRAITVNKIAWGINTAGASPTASRNFLGVYDGTSGARLASVGVDARVTTTGAWVETISDLALTPGFYYIAFLCTATTMPQIYRANDLNATLNNLNLPIAKLRFCTNGTGLTALPSSITLANNSPAQFTYFGALGYSE